MVKINDLWRFCRAKIVSSEINYSEKVLKLVVGPDLRYNMICAHCGTKLQDVHQNEYRTIRDIPVWGYDVQIEAHYRKGFCPVCQKIVVEHLEYTKPGLRITNRMVEYIVTLGRHLSDSEISRMLGLSRWVVRRIHFGALKEEYSDVDFGDVRFLLVDEISLRKGHRYATVIVDYERGRILDVIADRTHESLESFYNKLTLKQREAIEAVAMDMWKPYWKATQKMLPGADIVTDYFHLVRKYHSEVIDPVRKMIYQRADSEEEYKVIKKSRFILYKRRDRLKSGEKIKLKKLLETNSDLYTVYTLKEWLHSIFEANSIEEAHERIAQFATLAKESGIAKLIKFAKTVQEKAVFIVNYVKYKMTTGLIEGINNKIKLIKRQRYGCPKLEFFRLLCIDAFY